MISERLKIVSLGNSIQQSVISSQPNPLFNRKGREGREEEGRRRKKTLFKCFSFALFASVAVRLSPIADC
jgi:hypothetical protein